MSVADDLLDLSDWRAEAVAIFMLGQAWGELRQGPEPMEFHLDVALSEYAIRMAEATDREFEMEELGHDLMLVRFGYEGSGGFR